MKKIFLIITICFLFHPGAFAMQVINLDDSMIEDTPAFGVDLDTDFILGIAKVNQKVITLLDIDKILTSRQLVMIQN